MIQISRPALGHLARFFVPLVLSLGFTACSPKTESTPDTWKFTPPTLEMTNVSGTPLRIKATDFQNAKSEPVVNSFADKFAALRFAPSDFGFEVKFKTLCTSGDNKTGEYRQTLKIADRVSLLSVLPPETISPSAMSKDWICNFELIVTNDKGSASRGFITSVRTHFAKLAAQLSPAEAVDPTTSAIVRLICPTWWSDGSATDLAKLASSATVQGRDTRNSDRQPLCSVQMRDQSAKIVGTYRPTFESARFLISPVEILIPNIELGDLYHRRLFAWTMQNNENRPQTYFVATAPEAVRFAAVMDWAEPYGGLTLPVRIFPKFNLTGAIETRETAAGFYFRLSAGASARLELSSNRPTVTSLVGFVAGAIGGTSHLVVYTDLPMSVSVLANESDVSLLATATDAALDQAMRDQPLSDAKPLLTTMILEPNRGSGLLAYSNLGFPALNAKRKIQGPDCFEGKNILDKHPVVQ